MEHRRRDRGICVRLADLVRIAVAEAMAGDVDDHDEV
jgi:hypothetical protein